MHRALCRPPPLRVRPREATAWATHRTASGLGGKCANGKSAVPKTSSRTQMAASRASRKASPVSGNVWRCERRQQPQRLTRQQQNQRPSVRRKGRQQAARNRRQRGRCWSTLPKWQGRSRRDRLSANRASGRGALRPLLRTAELRMTPSDETRVFERCGVICNASAKFVWGQRARQAFVGNLSACSQHAASGCCKLQSKCVPAAAPGGVKAAAKPTSGRLRRPVLTLHRTATHVLRRGTRAAKHAA